MNLNLVQLIGRIVNDVELRSTNTGKKVGSFRIATNRTWKDASGQKREDAQFHNIVVWGKQAQLIAEYCTKGSLIYVEGHLQTRDYVGKDGQKRYVTEIVLDNMQFGPKPAGSAPAKNFVKKQEDDLPEFDDMEMPKSSDDIDIRDIPF
jgi:single-strand DNA-binding protein